MNTDKTKKGIMMVHRMNADESYKDKNPGIYQGDEVGGGGKLVDESSYSSYLILCGLMYCHVM